MPFAFVAAFIMGAILEVTMMTIDNTDGSDDDGRYPALQRPTPNRGNPTRVMVHPVWNDAPRLFLRVV